MHPTHLPNVETRFYCPQAFLSLDSQCREDTLNENRHIGIETSQHMHDEGHMYNTYNIPTTMSPMVVCPQAVGKPHTLWVAFAKFYERHGDIANARVIFDKATQVELKYMDDLATVWCEWAEMELRHKNFKRALSLMRQATQPPATLGTRQVGHVPFCFFLLLSLLVFFSLLHHRSAS